MLVIFNRMLKQAFVQQGNHVYKNLEEYYQWILSILACPSIAFVHKKILEPTLTLVVNHLAVPKQRFLEYLDNITQSNINNAASVFVYLETILKSTIRKEEIVSIIK